MRWIDDLQRMAVDAETAVLARSQRQVADARGRLAELDLPMLVLHSRGDQMNDFQRGRELAAGIRGARLVALESNNHIVLADEPAWPVFLREMTEFIAPDRVSTPAAVADRRGLGAVAARTRHPPPGRRRPRQRRDRRRAGAVGPNGRKAPAERVREARPAGTNGPDSGGGQAPLPRVLGARGTTP